MKKILLIAILFTWSLMMFADTKQDATKWNTPQAGNPFIPGYFADPTIKKFGDTYYLYATTDGTGNGYGPAQVWVSKDFRNWTNRVMDWPTTEVVWAPDVMKGADGLYHYFYCEPCVLHEGIGESPTGPWRNILSETDAVLVEDRFVHNAITLDGQTFVDDDGSVYIYFGTWGIYEGFGCGVAKFNPDMKTFSEKKLIPNTEIKDFFEAPFVLKRNGTYYFMYSSGSCHDHTYRVQYATSKVGPMGPYEYKGCILETNADGSVHGPGHHSVLQDGDDYYIVYHRHNIPQATHGFNRQICIDKLMFTDDGEIAKVVPTHDGVLPKSVQSMPTLNNLAYGAKVKASSYYDEWFLPQYVTDDNNATLWKPTTCTDNDYIEIDLGEEKTFNQIWTQFEFATFYYQYKIETSSDGQTWKLYADKTKNTRSGSPMIDKGETKARFIRITVTGREKNGHFGGIWNVKVLNLKDGEAEWMQETSESNDAWKKRHFVADGQPRTRHQEPIVDISATKYSIGTTIKTIANAQGGELTSEIPVRMELKDGKPAFHFTGTQVFKSNFGLPSSLEYCAPYTVVAWILNPKTEKNECVAQFIPDRHDLSTIELCNGSDPQNGLMMHNASFENSGAPQIKAQEGQWQHWVITYDGYMERHYLNGEMVSEKNMMLLLRPAQWMQIGASFEGNHPFDGYLHALQLYDRTLQAEEIKNLYLAPLNYNVEEAKALQQQAAKYELKGVTIEATAVTPYLLKLQLRNAQGEVMGAGYNDISYEIKGEGTTKWNMNPTVLRTLSYLGKHTITALARTPDGEIVKINTTNIKMDIKEFQGYVDYFEVPSLKKNWHFLRGRNAQDVEAKIENGELTLSSKSGNFNANADDNGALLYQELRGDFVMECMITGMTGSENRRTPSYNEGGLMVLDDSNMDDQQIVQMGVFPNYNCGNMLTTVSNHGRRPQFPCGNGWDYAQWMQIERQGTTFHVRISDNGTDWRETIGSPVVMPQMTDDKILKVGMFQTTYSDNKAAVTFDNFKLYVKKQK